MLEPYHVDFERHLCLESFMASKAPGIQCLTHGLLDLALRSNTYNL
jgi:hypothetical protein